MCVCGVHHPPPTSSCKASMADTMASWTRTASTSSFWLMIYFFSVFLAGHQTVEGAINCYNCSSRNGSDINCEDPFHPGMGSYYKTACMVPKEGHIGKFPANFCVKVKGTTYVTGEKLVIRTCTLENMENQCGEFRYEHETLSGCILTCHTDGCNAAGSNLPLAALLFLATTATAITRQHLITA